MPQGQKEKKKNPCLTSAKENRSSIAPRLLNPTLNVVENKHVCSVHWWQTGFPEDIELCCSHHSRWTHWIHVPHTCHMQQMKWWELTGHSFVDSKDDLEMGANKTYQMSERLWHWFLPMPRWVSTPGCFKKLCQLKGLNPWWRKGTPYVKHTSCALLRLALRYFFLIFTNYKSRRLKSWSQNSYGHRAVWPQLLFPQNHAATARLLQSPLDEWQMTACFLAYHVVAAYF